MTLSQHSKGPQSVVSLVLLGLVVGLLSSCYYDPYAMNARAYRGGTYAQPGQQRLPGNAYPQNPVAYQQGQALQYAQTPAAQPRPLGQRVTPSTAAAVAQPAPANQYQAPASNVPATNYAYAPATSGAVANDPRWNSGNNWVTRQQGARVNDRGSGDAWRQRANEGRAQDPVPTPSATWQTSAVYPANNAYANAPAAGVNYSNAGATTATYQNYGVGTTYEVRRGDSLSAIARDHQCSVSGLIQANNLDSSVIHPGQVLNIPR